METYKIYATVKVSSRYGGYPRKVRETVTAENEDSAKQFIKDNALSWYGLKRGTVIIHSVTKVER